MHRFIVLLLALFVAMGAFADAPSSPQIAARSYLLLDLTAGQTLAEKDADGSADPASLTKLMTAYLVFGALRDRKLTLEQHLPVSLRAWSERKGGGSLMFIDTTMSPTVDELLKGMIVQSGNDASVALAEAVSGSLDAFVAAMNRQAEAWNLKNTAFRNVTGLTEPGHHSTARDLSVIASHIIIDFPQFFPMYSMREYTYNKIRQDNRNLLLRRDPTVDGMKTGFTEAAGYCLIATANRDFPNGKRRLMAIVMGADSMQGRANEAQKLLNWGYTAFDAVRFFAADQAMATVPVWKGSAPDVRLGSASAVVIAAPHGEADKLKTTIERTDPLVAPLEKGQRVGTLKVTASTGEAVAEVPLVVLDPVPLAGIFGRAWDAIRLWIK